MAIAARPKAADRRTGRLPLVSACRHVRPRLSCPSCHASGSSLEAKRPVSQPMLDSDRSRLRYWLGRILRMNRGEQWLGGRHDCRVGLGLDRFGNDGHVSCLPEGWWRRGRARVELDPCRRQHVHRCGQLSPEEAGAR